MTVTPTIFPVQPDERLVSASMQAAASFVVSRLREHSHTAFFAGGFARDLIIGRPVHDIDIATDALPDAVENLFPDSRSFGKSFGVVQVLMDTHLFEVATFRTEGPYVDGRRPESVCFTTADQDANRRDFTVNGMFYDPSRSVIVDYVNGLTDVRDKIIRAIGSPEERFADDHLRLMRAVRFASVLEFNIEPQTWRAIQSSAHLLARISIERIRDELMRTLMESPHPGRALECLRDAGILSVILPEVQAMNGVEQPPEFHPEGDVFRHVCLMLENMRERSPELIWSILMHDVAKPPTFSIGTDKLGNPRIRFFGHAEKGAEMAVEIMRRFRCSNDLITAVEVAVRHHMRFSAVPEMRNATLRKWVGAPTFPLELELHRIDCISCHGSLDHYEQIKTFRDTLANEPALPAPLITGRDLMIRDIASGPLMGAILKHLYDQQLEGAFSDSTSALAWLDEHLASVVTRVSADIQS